MATSRNSQQPYEYLEEIVCQGDVARGEERSNGIGGEELAERVASALFERLKVEGNALTQQQQEALRAIPAIIEEMARGRAGSTF